MCLLASGCWKPRLSTGLSPTLLPVRCVIALPAALLANSNPFIFPPVLEFWLSEGHKFRTGLLFCKHGRGGPPLRRVRLASSSAAADEDRWDAAPRANSSGQRKQAIISGFGCLRSPRARYRTAGGLSPRPRPRSGFRLTACWGF